MTGIGKATNCWGPPSKVFLKTLRIDEQSLNIDSYFFHCAITLPSMNVFKEKLLNRLILRDKLFKKLCGYYPIKYANICVSQFRWSSGTLKVIWSQDFFLVLCHSSLKMYDNRSTIVLANSSNRPTLTVTITVHQIRGSLRCSKRYLARFIWFLNDTSFDNFHYFTFHLRSLGSGYQILFRQWIYSYDMFEVLHEVNRLHKTAKKGKNSCQA